MRKNITFQAELGKDRAYIEMHGFVWLTGKLYVPEVREKSVEVIEDASSKAEYNTHYSINIRISSVKFLLRNLVYYPKPMVLKVYPETSRITSPRNLDGLTPDLMNQKL